MKDLSYTHYRINMRVALVNAIITNGEQAYGGKGNATVSQKWFKHNAKIRANYLVVGLNQYR